MSCWGITNGCTAPEVIRGRLSSKESDMYSFGSLCYEIIRKLYGLSPDVDRDFPPRRLVNLPTDKNWLWSLICQSWKANPEARPTAVGVVKRIAAFSADVVEAPLWDESLYSRIRNNVDFGPLLANAAALRNRSRLAAIELSYRALLDKITLTNFNSISSEIIALLNKGDLACHQVALLVYERAIYDPRTSELYAKLCRKMLEQIYAYIWAGDDVKDAKGKAIAGGQLLRKDLCDRCREDFEGSWIAKVDGESPLDGDHKRRGLGLIKFIGELYNLQMLSKQSLHDYVKGLLGSRVKSWLEEHIESIHVLITTVGKSLDTTKADKRKMHTYVSKIREIKRRPNMTPRLQVMLQDVLDLRTRNWVPRAPQGEDRLTVKSQLDSGEDGTLNFWASEGPLSLSMLQSTGGHMEDAHSNDDQWIMVDSNEVG
ncbi:hypothetical protein AAF712_002966 [Marasmius tenuissimus]|uniref:MIF4G domain-containing protein n=1 Tax=Marasmius tenuissimus TaxID=585030 RepID=A0ABR3A9N6_9AGAR